MELDLINKSLIDFHSIVNNEKIIDNINKDFPLSVGIDLGTSSIVLVVLNHLKKPIYGAVREARVVRDGLVVNYVEAIHIVKQLKAKAEETIKMSLTHASGAVPPGTLGENFSVFSNIIESAEMEVVTIIDEPIAAAEVLKIKDGHIVDIGGGTTGIASFHNGEVIQIRDEPTGGNHMTLVLAGHYNLSIEQAEKLKRDISQQTENFNIILPVVEKMAEITQKSLLSNPMIEKAPVYIVGGASNFSKFKEVFAKTLQCPIYQPLFPELVTPLGIALSSYNKVGETDG